MLFAIDIDGTIALRNMPVFARICNERLRLGIDEERCATLLYRDLLQLPELLAYKERIGDLWFQRKLAWIDLEYDVLTAMRPMPGVLTAVRRLAEVGNVRYYTARKTGVPRLLKRNEVMAAATLHWLTAHEFPCADQAVFCVGGGEKLSKLADVIAREPQDVILIDDNTTKLLHAYTELDPRSADLLRSHLTLVAFRESQVPMECYGLPVLPLASWERIEILMEHLKGVPYGHRDSIASNTSSAHY